MGIFTNLHRYTVRDLIRVYDVLIFMALAAATAAAAPPPAVAVKPAYCITTHCTRPSISFQLFERATKKDKEKLTNITSIIPLR